MPEVRNFAQGAAPEKQNQDGMFWDEAGAGLVPHFAVKDSAGRDHVYETPAAACRFRIASDGSLRDVADLDGNPVEIRKAVGE